MEPSCLFSCPFVALVHEGFIIKNSLRNNVKVTGKNANSKTFIFKNNNPNGIFLYFYQVYKGK